MSQELERQAEAIFEATMELPTADRPAALAAACGGDAALAARVDALHAGARAAERFLSEPTMDAAPVTERPGTVIGRYKLLQQIGEGGFGVVFMAQQEKPVRRTVALKIIKLGMDTREVVARFEAERQALAMMDHPNIAKVLDAGSTETGRPYFVMELVRGSPITEFADKHRLSTRDRVSVAAAVCRAVQHAHSKGIIHRDLKPSNVLVTVTDDKPVPKVIDFGIAKATQSKLTDRTLFTAFRQLIGTPQYMSPEQADSDGSDVDTRTDVYSLGVVLYELLVGTTPLDARSLRSAAYEEMRRQIRDVDPPRPSTRLRTLAAGQQETVAAARSSDARRLGQAIHGELDWIVMRALEKDRARRYETAAALADDLNRYLAGEAVLAGPASGTYRLKKTLRRYRAAVAVGSAIAVTLLLGVAGTSAGLLLANRQRAAAVDSEKKAVAERTQAVADRAEADRQRKIAEADSAELGASIVAASDPRTSDRLIVRSYNLRLQVYEIDDPAVVRVLEKHAAYLWQHGARTEAVAGFQNAIEAIRRTGRTNSVTFAKLLYDHADLIRQLTNGGAGPAGAIPLLQEACDILRAIAPDDPDRGRDLLSLGKCAVDVGRPSAVETVLTEAYAFDLAHPNPDGTVSLESYNLLNRCLRDQGKPVAVAPKALDMPVSPAVARKKADDLARTHHSEEAEPFFRQTIALDRAAKPVDRLVLAADLLDLGTCLQRQSRSKLAEAPFREAMEVVRADLPPDDPGRIDNTRRFAGLLIAVGNAAEAVENWQFVVDSDNRTGATADVRAFDLRDLGRAMQKAGDLTTAAVTLGKAVGLRSSVSGATNSETAAVARSLADVLTKLGDTAGAQRVRNAAGIGVKRHATTTGASPRIQADDLAANHKARDAAPLYQAAVDPASNSPPICRIL